MSKKAAGQDYAVSKLEGLWEGVGPNPASPTWNWTLLIRTPDFVTGRDLKDAVRKLRDKRKDPAVGEVAINKLKEGRLRKLQPVRRCRHLRRHRG